MKKITTVETTVTEIYSEDHVVTTKTTETTVEEIKESEE